MVKREQWIVHNISTRQISLPLGNLPTISPGRRYDLLEYATREEIVQSPSVKSALQKQWIVIIKKYDNEVVATINDATASTGLQMSSGASTPGSVWRTGEGSPSNVIGIDGDFYLNSDNGDVYRRTSGSYGVVANIKGPSGSAG